MPRTTVYKTPFSSNTYNAFDIFVHTCHSQMKGDKLCLVVLVVAAAVAS